MKTLKPALPLTLILFLTACAVFRPHVGTNPISGVVGALNVVADAANTAVVLVSGLQVAGVISAEVATQVVTYAGAIATAADKSVTELNSKDTLETKIVNITGYFSAVAPPNVQGRAAQVVAIVRAVTAAVEMFLHQLNPASVVATTAGARAAPLTLPSAPQVNIQLSRGDHRLLGHIQSTSRQTAQDAANWKPK